MSTTEQYKPMIIGITGPLGSGCTKISKLIEKYIKNQRKSKSFLKEQNQKIESKIISFCKYLHESVESAGKNLSAITILDSEIEGGTGGIKNDTDFLRFILSSPKEVSSEYDRKIRSLRFNYEKKRVYILHQLRKLIKMKISIDTIRKIKWKDVEYYSMLDKIEEELIGGVDFFQDPANKVVCGSAGVEVFEEVVNSRNKDFEKIYFDFYQDLGDYLRYTKKDNAYVARVIISEIRNDINSGGCAKIYIVQSFRNPEEIYAFRKEFASDFILVSLYADKSLRFNRMVKKNPILAEDNKFNGLDNRDSGRGQPKWGQKITDCVLEADYSITNEKKSLILFLR